MRLYALIAALAAGSAMASQTARQGDDWVRLYDSPCVSAETLMRIAPPMREQFRKVQARFQGQTFFGCYIIRAGKAFVIYDDGDKGIIDLEDFKQDPEA